jgi:hypothetical protein
LFILFTVKRVDEVVRHPHLVTQDQNTQVSNKVSDISEENFTIISNFSDIFHKYQTSSTELESFKSMQHAGRELRRTGLQSAILPLRHTFLSIICTKTLGVAHTYKKMPASCASSVEMLYCNAINTL